MFEPLVESVRWLYSLIPTRFQLRRPQFHYITVHYIYMVGMTIIISIMLYPAGVLDYTDALFFAAGSATQSGLNTIDVSALNTYQQVVIMLLCCICTPIFINLVVVFVRLYWFEKRFKHIVEEARSQRRSRTRSMTSRSRSQMRASMSRGNEDQNEMDPSRLEMGVNGRKITVLHNTTKPNGMTGVNPKQKAAEEEFLEKLGLHSDTQCVTPTPEGSGSESSQRPSDADYVVHGVSLYKQDGEAEKGRMSEIMAGPGDSAEEKGLQSRLDLLENKGEKPISPPDDKETDEGMDVAAHARTNSADEFTGGRLHRNITFADEVSPELGNETPMELARVPDFRDMSKHISFIERQQQNAKKGGALRIPDPRAFDRGEVPEELDEDEARQRPLTRSSTRNTGSELSRQKRTRSEDATERIQPVRRGITIDIPDHPGHHAEGTNDGNDDQDAASLSRLGRLVGGFAHRRIGRNLSLGGEGNRTFAQTFSSITTSRTKEKVEDPFPYLSWEATIGRNSAFVGLTQHQREELGGIEYRSLKTLAGILMGYFFGFHILGFVILLPWILNTQPWRGIVVADGQSPAWWGIFTPASMFNDLGFTLTPDSMNSFEGAVLPLLFGSFLIVIGNTGFPCMLRFIIWSLSKIVPHGTGLWEELQFLLDHPRRCFTLLFPSAATWWLFWILVLLNGLDLIFFIVLDLNDPTVTTLSPGLRVLNGWFQAVSTRTAGFSCVNLSTLHPAIQVSYLIMMYISVFPIAISVRRTNVYEEKSLGIFPGDDATPAQNDGLENDDEPSYVGQHLRRQLSFDLWYIFLGLFIIAIVEGDRLVNSAEEGFTLFAVLFEIVSAYGTVGLSLGYSGINASLSAEFRVLSKLVIIAMMIRGRHRGLPYALDRAILLPHDKLKAASQERDAQHRLRSRKPSLPNPPPRRSTVANDGDDQNHFSSRIPYAFPDDALAEEQSPSEPPSPTSPQPRVSSSPPPPQRPASFMLRNSRRRSLSRVLVGGLSAGPTWAKRE